jgi:hypothetical protein
LGAGDATMKFLVVITCPDTGREVPTGLVTDITTFANLPKDKTQLSCPACGQVHDWTRRDAFLAHSLEGLLTEQAGSRSHDR